MRSRSVAVLRSTSSRIRHMRSLDLHHNYLPSNGQYYFDHGTDIPYSVAIRPLVHSWSLCGLPPLLPSIETPMSNGRRQVHRELGRWCCILMRSPTSLVTGDARCVKRTLPSYRVELFSALSWSTLCSPRCHTQVSMRPVKSRGRCASPHALCAPTCAISTRTLLSC